MTTTAVTAQKLSSVQLVMTGRMSLDLVLDVAGMELRGVVGGRQKRKEVDLQKVYALMAFLETLHLPPVVVPPGRPPRGQSVVHLRYGDGAHVVLGMNLNTAGLEYLELDTDQFQQLLDLWAAMATEPGAE